MLKRDGCGSGFDCFLDGNDMHADSPTAHGNHGSNALQGHLGHQVKKCRDIRVLCHQLIVHDHELGDARNKNRYIVPQLFCWVLTIRLNAADPHQVFQHFIDLRLCKRRVHFHKLRVAVVCPGFLETEHELYFILVHDLIEAPDLRVVRTNGMGVFCHITVRNHTSQTNQQLQLFSVRIDKIFRKPVITFVRHSVLLFVHIKSSPFLLSCAAFPRKPALFLIRRLCKSDA